MPGTGKTACVKKVINKYPQQYFNMMHYPKIEVSGELREGYTVGIDEFDLVEQKGKLIFELRREYPTLNLILISNDSQQSSEVGKLSKSLQE